MPTVRDICAFLDRLAPPELAESWDNTGLLVGDASAAVAKVMTCLTITPESAAEAISESANLIVTHHPLPFRPLTRITTETTVGRLLWDLIRHGVSIYSAHTRFDSTWDGINQRIGERIGLVELRPLQPVALRDAVVSDAGKPPSGAGRIGELQAPQSLQEFAHTVRIEFGLPALDIAGALSSPVRTVAIACGSGGSLLEAACRLGCDTFLTGETNFHAALECRALGVSLVLLGHYTSERFAMEALAEQLADAFGQVDCWASRTETDPLERVE